MKDLNELFQSFETGIRSGKADKPREYLNSIGLDYNHLRIGFNSGQFHHRETQEVKDEYERMGLLTKSTAAVRQQDMVAYTVFGKYGIIFPLMDSNNHIVNYYAIRFNLSSPKEDYLNDKGIYPHYPPENTKRLFITPTVMDAASLLQSRVLDQREAVVALHDGELLPQHSKAIVSLNQLEEILLIKR